MKKVAFPRLRCSFLRRCVLERSGPAMERTRPVSVHAVPTTSIQNMPTHRISERKGIHDMFSVFQSKRFFFQMMEMFGVVFIYPLAKDSIS